MGYAKLNETSLNYLRIELHW